MGLKTRAGKGGSLLYSDVVQALLPADALFHLCWLRFKSSICKLPAESRRLKAASIPFTQWSERKGCPPPHASRTFLFHPSSFILLPLSPIPLTFHRDRAIIQAMIEDLGPIAEPNNFSKGDIK
jgi:hypothetical protein